MKGASTLDRDGQRRAQESAAAALLRARRPLRVGDREVNLCRNEVLADGQLTRISPRAAAVLEVLIHYAGQPVSKDRLLAEVWRDETPTEDVVIQAIVELRRALGDNARQARYIRTLPRVGYLLEASVSAAQQRQAAPPGWRWLRPLWPWPTLGAGVVVMLLGALVVRQPLQPPPPTLPKLTEVRTLTSALGREANPALSPDGSRLVYSARDLASGRWQLEMLALGSEQPVVLIVEADRDLVHPTWSPDGARIAFRSEAEDCVLTSVASTGAGLRRLASCSSDFPGPFAFEQDGSALLLGARMTPDNPLGRILRIDLVSGSRSLVESERQQPTHALNPRPSPDGQLIAFLSGSLPFSSLHLLDRGSGREWPLTGLMGSIRGFDWTPDGRALVFASDHEGSSALHYIALDRGEITPLGIADAAHPQMARMHPGLVFERQRRRSRIVRLTEATDVRTVAVMTPASTGTDRAPAVAPDGRLSFVSDRGGSDRIWIRGPGSNLPTALTGSLGGAVYRLEWSPDASRLLAVVQHPERSRLIEIDVSTGQQLEIETAQGRFQGAVYGDDKDTVYTLAARAGDLHLDMLQRTRLGWERRALPLVGGSLRRDHASGAVYLLSGVPSGVLRLAGEHSSRIAEIRQPFSDWAVHDGIVVIMTGSTSGQAEVVHLNGDGDPAVSMQLAPELAPDRRFHIAPDGTLLVAEQLADDSDVGYALLH